MSKREIIRKEDLSAFQRWEIAALDEPAHEPAPVVEEIIPEAPALPTAEEIERVHEQARQEGYAAGHQEGFQAGYQEAAATARRLAGLLDGLEQSLEALAGQLQEQVLSLTLSLARQVLRQALQVKPELMLAVVQEALAEVSPGSRSPRLFLHPEDAGLVRQHLAGVLQPDGWRIVEDPHMQRGGCRLETAESMLDAGIESRWARVLAVFGHTDSWADA